MMKYDKKSYTPVKVAAVMDALSILVSFYRLSKANSSLSSKSQGPPSMVGSSPSFRLRSIEKRELHKRIRFMLLKYLIRDPIYEQFTKKILEKIFLTLKMPPKLLGLLFSLLNYFRYYTYTA